jgi:hypothetical protein
MICRGHCLERVETALYHNHRAKLYPEPDLGFCVGLCCILYCDEDNTLYVRKKDVCVCLLDISHGAKCCWKKGKGMMGDGSLWSSIAYRATRETDYSGEG